MSAGSRFRHFASVEILCGLPSFSEAASKRLSGKSQSSPRRGDKQVSGHTEAAFFVIFPESHDSTHMKNVNDAVYDLIQSHGKAFAWTCLRREILHREGRLRQYLVQV